MTNIEKNDIKAVLFDLDGVLIEAREWHYEALNKALGLFGYIIARKEHENYYNGLPTRIKLSKLTEDKKLPESLHDFIYEMKQKYTRDYIYNYTKPSFDKQIMLKILREHGLKLAVCSNAIRSTVEMMLEKAMIKDYFDVLLSNQDVKNNKPDPEIYLVAMKKLGIQPSETLIVEDSPHGIEAAKSSGGNVIIVRDASEVNLSIFKGRLSYAL